MLGRDVPDVIRSDRGVDSADAVSAPARADRRGMTVASIVLFQRTDHSQALARPLL
jgi:hypothetical protein